MVLTPSSSRLRLAQPRASHLSEVAVMATDRLKRLQTAVDHGVDGLSEAYRLLNGPAGAWPLSWSDRSDLEKVRRVLAEVARYLDSASRGAE